MQESYLLPMGQLADLLQVPQNNPAEM